MSELKVIRLLVMLPSYADRTWLVPNPQLCKPGQLAYLFEDYMPNDRIIVNDSGLFDAQLVGGDLDGYWCSPFIREFEVVSPLEQLAMVAE